MKHRVGIAVGLFSALLLAPVVMAGLVLGTLRENNQPVAAGTDVELVCGGNPPVKAKTAADGSYKVLAKEPGKCTLRVTYKGQTASAEVLAYEQPTKYDFDLVPEGGKYALRRR